MPTTGQALITTTRCAEHKLLHKFTQIQHKLQLLKLRKPHFYHGGFCRLETTVQLPTQKPKSTLVLLFFFLCFIFTSASHVLPVATQKSGLTPELPQHRHMSYGLKISRALIIPL